MIIQLALPLMGLLAKMVSIQKTAAKHTRACTAAQLWSDQQFHTVQHLFEVHLALLDHGKGTPSGEKSRWTKEYFQSFSANVWASYEHESQLERKETQRNSKREQNKREAVCEGSNSGTIVDSDRGDEQPLSMSDLLVLFYCDLYSSPP